MKFFTRLKNALKLWSFHQDRSWKFSEMEMSSYKTYSATPRRPMILLKVDGDDVCVFDNGSITVNGMYVYIPKGMMSEQTRKSILNLVDKHNND